MSTQVIPSRPIATKSTPITAIVDCDIHNLASPGTLAPYLPEPWRRHHETYGFREYHGLAFPRYQLFRVDAEPGDGSLPGSSLEFMREQLLDPLNVELGILNPVPSAPQRNDDYSAALSTAVNEWVAAEWLTPEPRLRGSIVVNYEDAASAVAEIHRCAKDSRFLQVHLKSFTLEPLGRRRYWPIYEAAESLGLPIGIHPNEGSAHPTSGAGPLSYLVEQHAGIAGCYQALVTSLVFEGVFEAFPDLKVILIEGGFAWLAPLMWRLDRAWERLGSEIPRVTRPPSEYIREHFWVTTQPMEEPPVAGHFISLLEQLDMNDRLMFATDYPHWDYDDPIRAFPKGIPNQVKRRFLGDNARALYGLASTP